MLNRFAAKLETELTFKSPKSICKRTAQTWNGIVDRHKLPHSRVTVPSAQGYQTLPLKCYPLSFQQDVKLWIKRLGEPDLMADDGLSRALRPSSLRNVESLIRQSAMALVNQGVSADLITSLSYLVQFDSVKRILTYFIERNGGTPPSWLGPTIAAQLLAIARHHAGLPAQDVKKLGALKSKVMVNGGGLTEKNRQRLRQFDLSANVYRIVRLPAALMARAGKEQNPSSRTALEVMHAVAIEILLNCPLRAQTLSTINVETDLKWSGHGKGRFAQLYIPPERVKNREPIEADFQPSTSAMIQVYLEKFRHSVSKEPGPWLFPAAAGGARSPGHLGEDIKARIKRETGLVINIHLFRSLALELQDRVLPGRPELGRQLLGHRRAETTAKYYASRNGKRAAANYQEKVLSQWKKK